MGHQFGNHPFGTHIFSIVANVTRSLVRILAQIRSMVRKNDKIRTVEQ